DALGKRPAGGAVQAAPRGDDPDTADLLFTHIHYSTSFLLAGHAKCSPILFPVVPILQGRRQLANQMQAEPSDRTLLDRRPEVRLRRAPRIEWGPPVSDLAENVVRPDLDCDACRGVRAAAVGDNIRQNLVDDKAGVMHGPGVGPGTAQEVSNIVR